MYRRIAHGFFNVAKSQFNRRESYKKIKTEILQYMNDPVFKEAIDLCHFTGSIKALMMEYALKRKWILLMCIFDKIS